MPSLNFEDIMVLLRQRKRIYGSDLRAHKFCLAQAKFFIFLFHFSSINREESQYIWWKDKVSYSYYHFPVYNKSVDYSSSGLHVISLSIRQWILDSYSFKPCLSRGVPKGYDFQFPFQFFQNFRFPPIIIIDFRFRVDPNLIISMFKFSK